MRLPKPSSRSVPTIACSGTPAWRVRVPISPTSLPCSVCSSSLPSPVTTARDARMRWSKSSASRTNGAPASSAAPWSRPQPAGQAAGAAGHRHAARVARERLRELVQPLLEPLDHGRVRALLRPEDLRRVLEDGADVAQHDDLRLADAAGLLDRLERARRRRRSWPSRRRRRGSRRRRPARRRRSARRCRRWRRSRRRARPRPRGRGRTPSPSRRSPCRRPRSGRSRCGRARRAGP